MVFKCFERAIKTCLLESKNLASRVSAAVGNCEGRDCNLDFCNVRLCKNLRFVVSS